MVIEITAICKYKKEFGGDYTEIVSGFVNNKTINEFDFNKYTKQVYDELKKSEIYEDVRISNIEIKSWDLSNFCG